MKRKLGYYIFFSELSVILSYIIIISSFILFRIVGNLMIDSFFSTQIGFLVFEIIEVSIGLFLLKTHKTITYKM